MWPFSLINSSERKRKELEELLQLLDSIDKNGKILRSDAMEYAKLLKLRSTLKADLSRLGKTDKNKADAELKALHEANRELLARMKKHYAHMKQEENEMGKRVFGLRAN